VRYEPPKIVSRERIDAMMISVIISGGGV